MTYNNHKPLCTQQKTWKYIKQTLIVVLVGEIDKYNIIETLTYFSTDQQDRAIRQPSKDIEDTNSMVNKGDEL